MDGIAFRSKGRPDGNASHSPRTPGSYTLHEHPGEGPMKNLTALLASFLIAGTTGAAMLGIGGNALLNKNTVPLADSPATASQADPPGSSSAISQADLPSSAVGNGAAQIQQLKDLIAQYQQRDQQYQSQLDQAVQQLNQENSQIQAYQQLLLELQQRGVIVITQDGRVLLPRG